ncbi:MAG: TIGR04002 family protein [Oscillospiraceae bacterium]|jgi:uncharacterized repeat protein (TIGR04002 family)|nr:TIGR04002 family protein [Oscillospiraceae bacterium]
MANKKTLPLSLAGLFAALIFVFTAYLSHIPWGSGYIHVGDAFIYLAASFLPTPLAAAAAAAGAGLADLVTAPVWTLYTVVIKILLTLPFTARRDTLMCPRNIAAALAAFPITMGGYYMAEWMIFQNAAAPLVELPRSALQSAGSLAVYLLVAAALDRAGLKKRLK